MKSALGVVIAVVGVVGAILTGCGGAATPTPAPQAGSGSTPAGSVAASPSAQPSAAAPAADSWKAEWDRTLAAAKKEGKVVVVAQAGESEREAATAFEKAYPDIKLEFSGMPGPDAVAKVLAEREGGQYLWDIVTHGAPTFISTLKPKGVLDPIRPNLLLPEVLDDTQWLGGFDDGWMDAERKYIYGFVGYLTFLGYVNRDLVPESELNSVDQLIDPRWKGKINIQDPRQTGSGSVRTQMILTAKGEDFLRRLLAQDLQITRDIRGQVEAVVRGRVPIGLGIQPSELRFFQSEGIGKNVKPLAPDSDAGAAITSGSGTIVLINKAAHPNAAKVYLNWLLSKEGQAAYAKATGYNSRRLDVKGPEETAPAPGAKYQNIQKEEMAPYRDRAIAIAKELVQ